MNYTITGNNFTSPLLRGYTNDRAFTVVAEKDLRTSNIIFKKDDKVYAPDETSVPAIMSKFENEVNRRQVDVIKNKYKCRKLLKGLYPKLYFKAIKIDELKDFVLPNINNSYFVKPQKGFFGVGVKKIDKGTNLVNLTKELKEEIKKGSSFFSKDVFTAEDFLIEECIEGEEYTFDLYYDQRGKPVIVNFCHHPMSAIKEYFHLLYYTCPEIYKKFAKQVEDIFTKLNKTLGVKNLPIHVEFKERAGELIPIEINIPRFGGFGLADLPYYGYGVNSFGCFFEGTKPDWKNILKKHQGKYYGWVLCYNGIDVDVEKYQPDYGKLIKDLGGVIHYYQLDCKNNPVFCIAYVEKTNKKELDNLLKMDFRDYFVPIEKKVGL